MEMYKVFLLSAFIVLYTSFILLELTSIRNSVRMYNKRLKDIEVKLNSLSDKLPKVITKKDK